MVYDLGAWPRIPINNFKLKNGLIGANNRVKNKDKEKWVYSGYGMSFDGASLWKFF